MDYFTDQIKKLVSHNYQIGADLQHYKEMIPLLEAQYSDNADNIEKLLSASETMGIKDNVYTELSLTYPDAFPPLNTEQINEQTNPSQEDTQNE